jgi:hypothetical protein
MFFDSELPVMIEGIFCFADFPFGAIQLPQEEYPQFVLKGTNSQITIQGQGQPEP